MIVTKKKIFIFKDFKSYHELKGVNKNKYIV